MLKLNTQQNSKIDSTQKYVFQLQGQEVEFSYINKNDGKDIIVCPSQTSCKLGCTFCFLTGMDLPVINLSVEDICQGVNTVIQEAGLPKEPELLLSFMGSGEPLLNYKNVLKACWNLSGIPGRPGRKLGKYKSVRYAVATMLPICSQLAMREFTRQTKLLPLKLHLSLHSPFDEIRKKLMPKAADVRDSVEALRFYKAYTQNPIEIHYTLIAGYNDRDEDLAALIELLDSDTPIKFLDFKSKLEDELCESKRVKWFRKGLEKASVPTEFYAPPGADIGSSCGQFIRGRK